MSQNQNTYLAAMGISQWQLRPVSATLSKPNAINSVEDAEPKLTWEALQQAVTTCRACSLHASRTQTVFGVGNRQADLMLIGEAPGFYEDQQGEPFVGRAGQLLNALLRAIKLERKQVYIANILKCRPPNNRDPQPEEVALCTPFLNRQIELIQPKLLLALGRIAAHYLLNNKQALAQLRGQVYSYGITQVPLIVSYHPAYLLRNPRDKAQAWQDWLLAKQRLEKSASSTAR